MITKRALTLTIVIQLICWSLIIFILFEGNKQAVQAATFPQEAVTETFLGSLYYGQEDIVAVFDHKYPLFGGYDDDVEPENKVWHYDGTEHEDSTNGYGYDAHVGIDYTLYYEPVLAASDGKVKFAGWSDPGNHRLLYGLHVQMIHNGNLAYRVWYGHLSTLSVQTDENILIDPFDLGNRSRILGISGNTGKLQGCDDPVGAAPNCSDHLHFEVRQIDGNRPVNPYGWIGLEQSPPIADPWLDYSGVVSHNLWINPPALLTDDAQYPGGTPVTAPSVNKYAIQVDDSDPEFFTAAGYLLVIS